MDLIVFDIDGTLIHSHAKEVDCFATAVEEVLGIPEIERDLSTYQHISDSGILKECVYKTFARHPTLEETQAVEERYFALFKHCLIHEPIQPIAGAQAFISTLTALPHIGLAVATGSHYAAAQLKLSQVAPALCQVPMGTSSDSEIRTTIMEIALLKAKATYQREDFNRIIYVGDGPWDVHAVRQLQWGFIGIASNYTKSTLQEWGAKCVIENYLQPTDFFEQLQSPALSF